MCDFADYKTTYNRLIRQFLDRFSTYIDEHNQNVFKRQNMHQELLTALDDAMINGNFGPDTRYVTESLSTIRDDVSKNLWGFRESTNCFFKQCKFDSIIKIAKLYYDWHSFCFQWSHASHDLVLNTPTTITLFSTWIDDLGISVENIDDVAQLLTYCSEWKLSAEHHLMIHDNQKKHNSSSAYASLCEIPDFKGSYEQMLEVFGSNIVLIGSESSFRMAEYCECRYWCSREDMCKPIARLKVTINLSAI